MPRKSKNPWIPRYGNELCTKRVAVLTREELERRGFEVKVTRKRNTDFGETLYEVQYR